MSWKHVVEERALPRNYFTWELDRPAPALPNSYFWTANHSTNWMLDDPGMQITGCDCHYFKHPETYVEDYRRLTDLARGLGIRGIVLWSFLRDSQGGVENAKRITAYAAKQGVEIYPGIGVTAYNGVYYEGDHKYSLRAFLQRNPDAKMLREDGTPRDHEGCIAHPGFREWFAESVDWLFREFDIQGCNLENGDLIVDHHPLMQELRQKTAWPEDDSSTSFNQAMSYKLALDSIPRDLNDIFASYATYFGFNLGDGPKPNGAMGWKPPAVTKVVPETAYCQWTLSGMIHHRGLPLTLYLDNGAPEEILDTPTWPRDLRPPTKRSVGFVHQGSQWWDNSRYRCVVSSIKEACLRAYLSGMQGVSIHGEVSSQHFEWAMNYLAFSHFTHWPLDTMRNFGRKTLGQIFNSAQDGEDFAEVLCHWDARTLSEEHLKLADPASHGFPGPDWTSRCANVEEWQRARLWIQLHGYVKQAFNQYSVDVPSPFVY